MEETTVLIAILVFLTTTVLSWKILSNGNGKQPETNLYKKWKSKWISWQEVIFPGTIATFLIMFILEWTGILTF